MFDAAVVDEMLLIRRIAADHLDGSALFPDISERTIFSILGIATLLAPEMALAFLFVPRDDQEEPSEPDRATWRMTPVGQLAPPADDPAHPELDVMLRSISPLPEGSPTSASSHSRQGRDNDLPGFRSHNER